MLLYLERRVWQSRRLLLVRNRASERDIATCGHESAVKDVLYLPFFSACFCHDWSWSLQISLGIEGCVVVLVLLQLQRMKCEHKS